MAYSTTLQFSQRSGLGIRIIDENVGTGNGVLASYDLDNDNVIAGSYVLSYAVTATNVFTALTETTHYTLDKDSGRINLTTAGVTLLDTNILDSKLSNGIPVYRSPYKFKSIRLSSEALASFPLGCNNSKIFLICGVQYTT